MATIKKVIFDKTTGNWRYQYECKDVLASPMILEGGEYSVYDIEKMLRKYVDEWGRIPTSPLNNACTLVLKDSGIREKGKRMQSRYPGKTIFGESVNPGDEIFYHQMGIVLAVPTAHQEWMK